MNIDEAEKHLAAWEAADLAIAVGKSYTIGNRQLTRADAEEVRNQISYWWRITEGLRARQAGIKNSGVAVAVFNR